MKGTNRIDSLITAGNSICRKSDIWLARFPEVRAATWRPSPSQPPKELSWVGSRLSRDNARGLEEVMAC
jgi:hypothetical protein